MSENHEKPTMILAEFKNPAHLLEAAKMLKEAGYKKFD